MLHDVLIMDAPLVIALLSCNLLLCAPIMLFQSEGCSQLPGWGKECCEGSRLLSCPLHKPS